MRYEDLTHSFQGLSVNDHLATDTSLPPASSPNHQASEVYAQGIDVGRRFRILVTGRLGAGKTTLLSRICLRPYEQRSEEIEEELSHTSFIFHDSVGFESAGDSKINLVKAFIADRAKATSLSSRLHAIWYCIRTDTHMHFSPGDMQFFGSNIAGDVPIIVVFTRFDGLESMAYAKLRDTFGRAESKAKRFDRALELLQSRYILPLRAMRYPPAECVRMDNLTTETPTYADLIRVTLTLLSGDILRPILISVQQLNVDLCMERAIVQCQDTQNLPSLLPAIMSCYPHIWRTHEDYADPVISIGQGSPDHDLHLRLSSKITECSPLIYAFMLPRSGTAWTLTKRAQAIAAICICIEHTFMEAGATGAAFPEAFETALRAYFIANHALSPSPYTVVNKEIAKLPPQFYREATEEADGRIADIIKSNRLRKLLAA